MQAKDPNLVKLGKQIRMIRKQRGFTQEGFATEAEIDRSYMGGIERGERNIAAINLIRIAKTLKVEVGELFPPIKTFK
jgi:transcriptional regulator with XRE-family HTH domain